MADQEPAKTTPPDPKEVQQAYGCLGVFVLAVLALAVWVVKTWNEKGVEGFTSLFTSFWETAVIGSLRAMGERDFWLDSFLGYVLICLIWAVALVALGAFTLRLGTVIKSGWQLVLPRGLSGLATAATFAGLALVLGGVIYAWMWPTPKPVVEDLDIPLRLKLLDEMQADPFYADPTAAKERLTELKSKVEFLQPDPFEREYLTRDINRAYKFAEAVEKTPRDDWADGMMSRMATVRESCAVQPPAEPEDPSFPFGLAVMLLITTFVVIGGASQS